MSSAVVPAVVARRAISRDSYFYFAMSLLLAVIVTFGFSQTIRPRLILATPPRPEILYLHGAVFSSWILFFIWQSVLVRTRHVRWHRRLGWFGVALGTAVPVLGVATSITMDRFHIDHLHSGPAMASFLSVQLWDMAAFSVAFGLAVYWRKRPEFHRRMILVASCLLTDAAFARFPLPGSHQWFYVGADLLVLLGVLRDFLATRTVHRIYLYTLPVLVVGQSLAMYLFLTAPPFWMRIAHAILY